MDIFEIIIPLIIAAIYFFGNMFSGKSEDESAPKGGSRRRNEDQDADAIERQRRIQEEIRRKIMERRQEAKGASGAPAPSSAPAQNQPSTSYSEGPADRELRERREVVQRRRAEREQEEQGSAGASRTAPAEHSPQESEAAFSWDTSDNAYESQMQERLQQIEATKRRAEQLKQQVGQAGAPASRRPQSSTSSPRLFRSSVRSSLSDPAAARAAFIYAEVLGQPISQRKTPTVPGLSN